MTEQTTEETVIDDAEPVAEVEQDETNGNREAAKYRTRAREAELVNESLKGRIGMMMRREVDRLTSDRLAQAGDLFEIGGVKLEDLVDGEGDVDPDKVEKAVKTLLDSRPGLARVERRMPDFGAGNRGSAVTGTSDKWGAVLGKNRRR